MNTLARVAALDPALASELSDEFQRLSNAGSALAWAWDRLPALVACAGPFEILSLLVDTTRDLTNAPVVWAVTWTGELAKSASFHAVARSGGASIPAPGEVSRMIVGRAIAEGRPVWTDDALADARFRASHSVAAYVLRSVGCVPVGTRGALYLADPDHPGRFSPESRLRIAALGSLAAPLLDAPAGPARPPPEPVPGIVGSAAAMGELYRAIRAFASMPWPALVLGETGTGKEAVARALHDLGPRSRSAFVAVNCGAIPHELAESTLFGHERGAFTGADRRREGLVERAAEGTLFLDEVGELDARLQVKLLRLLQQGTFERVGGDRELFFRGRIVAATHRPLDQDRAGGFRDDLYHRLAACVLRVPALRDRRSDIGALATVLLARACAEVTGAPALQLAPAAKLDLAARDWPGNVRELENALRGAVARALIRGSSRIDLEDLDGSAPRPVAQASGTDDLEAATEVFVRGHVLGVLERHGDNRTRAAAALGVSRQWLHRLLAKWEVSP